ncbi:hypothetical protein PMAYCL1PPCAC_30516, partial [Pristionchus mayeri]
MTVSYTAEVSTASHKLSFSRMLFRWRGSLWKLVWFELLLWCAAFTLLSVSYRVAMTEEQRVKFEWVCLHAARYADYLPLSFLLGSFVTFIVSRWHKQFNAIGWVDKSIMLTSSHIGGSSDRARMIRRGVTRQMCLLQILIYRSICVPVRRRFPTVESLRDAGYLLPDELPDINDTKYWIPIKWAMEYVRRARDEGMITSDNAVQDIYQELLELRGKLLRSLLFDLVPVPLNYTQIVFMAVRMYFVVELFGRQFLDPTRVGKERHTIDCYVPFISLYQFIVYVGWVKVAEALLNPFGEDDDDFETNWIIDRNLKAGLDISDHAADFAPPLEKDMYWDEPEVVPFYSAETANEEQFGAVGSAVQKDEDEFTRRGSIMSIVSSAMHSISNWSLADSISRRNSIDPTPSYHFNREKLTELGNRVRNVRKFSEIAEVEEGTPDETITSMPKTESKDNLRRIRSN